MHGLPLWQDAQAAVDTAPVSPASRAGGAQPHADRIPDAALEQAAKRKRLHAYTELAVGRRCKLVVLGLEVGGRFGPKWFRAARCAATASVPVLRCKKARCTDGRSRTRDSRARVLANCR